MTDAISVKGKLESPVWTHPLAMPGRWVSEISRMIQSVYSGKSPRTQRLAATRGKTVTAEFKMFSDDSKFISQNPTD